MGGAGKAFIKLIGIIILMIFAGAVISAIIDKDGSISRHPAPLASAMRVPQPKAEMPHKSHSVPLVACATHSGWKYDDVPDKMRSRSMHCAQIQANEELFFKFPYQGGSTATLLLMSYSARRTDVCLVIDKGQFLCNYPEQTVAAKLIAAR